MPWYKSGTVSCTQNSTTVTGTSTAFAANARVGDAFMGPDGRWYEVVNVASDTVLSIQPAYIGATVSAGSYALAPMQGYVKDSADALRTLVNKFGALAASAPINALAALTGAAGKFPYFTDAQTMALATLTDYAKSGQNSDIKALTGLTTALAVNMGGTGVTSMAALLSALVSAGAYSKSTAVGAVGQTSGTPTGAIIERGSNANGDYTRYADGTQECWTRALDFAVPTAGANAQISWPPPAAFVSNVSAVLAVVQYPLSNDSYVCQRLSGYQIGGSTITIQGRFDTAQTYRIAVYAKGRWF